MRPLRALAVALSVAVLPLTAVTVAGAAPGTDSPAPDATAPEGGTLRIPGLTAPVSLVRTADGGRAVTADVLRWALRQGLDFDLHPSDAGEVWSSRLEIYETNPLEVPDPAQARTTLAFRLAD